MHARGNTKGGQRGGGYERGRAVARGGGYTRGESRGGRSTGRSGGTTSYKRRGGSSDYIARNDTRETSRPRRYYHDGGGSYDTRYRSGGVRYADNRYYGSRNHTYYTSSFCRPSYVYRSGFSLGVVIASVPAYGYGYWDPYCRTRFRSLDYYYDHCHEYGHSHAVLLIELASWDPIATCVYSSGRWVVDDCCY